MGNPSRWHTPVVLDYVYVTAQACLGIQFKYPIEFDDCCGDFTGYVVFKRKKDIPYQCYGLCHLSDDVVGDFVDSLILGPRDILAIVGTPY